MSYADDVLKDLADAPHGVTADAIIKKYKMASQQSVYSVMNAIRKKGNRAQFMSKTKVYKLLPAKRAYNMTKRTEAPKSDSSDNWIMIHVRKAQALTNDQSRTVYLGQIHKTLQNQYIMEAIEKADTKIKTIHSMLK